MNREHGVIFDDVKRALRESRMLKHGDFPPQDDHRDDQPDRDGRPDDAEYPDVDRVVGRAEFARGPFEETDALAENEVDHIAFARFIVTASKNHSLGRFGLRERFCDHSLHFLEARACDPGRITLPVFVIEGFERKHVAASGGVERTEDVRGVRRRRREIPGSCR